MKNLNITLTEIDGDINIYDNVTAVEIKDNEITIEYDEHVVAKHLVNYTEEITIKPNR